MNSLNRWSVAAVCAMALVVGARAWGEEKKAGESKDDAFAKCDADHDGKVTLVEYVASREAYAKAAFAKKGEKGTFEEFFAPQKAKIEAKFKKLDANGDGTLSKEEFDAGRGMGKHGEKHDK